LTRAFTLVELLVTIGIVLLILGILLPAFARARGSAEFIKSLSNARQLGQVVSMYAERSGFYPATEDGRLYPTGGPGNEQIAFGYWQIYETWTGVVYDLLPYHQAVEAFVSPASPRLGELLFPWPTSYHYSTSFAGQPRLWAIGASAQDALRHSVTSHQVQFPSSKVLLWDAELGWATTIEHDPETGDLITRSPTLMTDGSGAGRVHARATSPVPNPYLHALSQRRLHNTPEGVAGRDY